MNTRPYTTGMSADQIIAMNAEVEAKLIELDTDLKSGPLAFLADGDYRADRMNFEIEWKKSNGLWDQPSQPDPIREYWMEAIS